MTKPGSYDLTIYQGATLSKVFTWKSEAGTPINLTGYTARMHIRDKQASAVTLLELTTANNKVALGGVAGTITLLLSAAETAALTWKRGVYDLELQDAAGKVTRLLEGSVTVDPEVTR